MRRVISNTIAALLMMPTQCVADFGAQYQAYGWFSIGNAIFYYILYQCGITLYDNLWLRLACIALGSLLIVAKRWPARYQCYLPLYWYVTVCLTLPIFFTYMLIMNHFSSVWIGTTIAVIFFVHLLVDFSSAIFLLVLGSLLGLLLAVCVLFLTSSAMVVFPDTVQYVGFFLLYIVANVIVAMFSYHRHKIEQYQRDLIRSEAESKEKSEFIENMSHDLRIALTGIQSVAEYESSQLARSHPQYDSWAMVHESSKQLHDFIDDLLRTAKYGVVKVLEESESFDVSQMVCSVVTFLKPAWQAKSLQCQILPQNFEPLPVLRGHPSLLQRLLLNLLNNAIKFTEPHGEIHVLFELKRGSDESPPQLILSVSDTGIGISKAHQAMIFQAFRRVVPAYKQSSHQGNGLGLHMVNKILALLGGQIAIESELEQGSVFTCTIPVEMEDDNAVALCDQPQSHQALSG